MRSLRCDVCGIKSFMKTKPYPGVNQVKVADFVTLDVCPKCKDFVDGLLQNTDRASAGLADALMRPMKQRLREGRDTLAVLRRQAEKSYELDNGRKMEELIRITDRLHMAISKLEEYRSYALGIHGGLN